MKVYDAHVMTEIVFTDQFYSLSWKVSWKTSMNEQGSEFVYGLNYFLFVPFLVILHA